MLSIIISSYQPHYYTALEKNIAETCGVPYEIIKIDNPGIMGICEAYNKGGAKAQYENLLFLHEDIHFHTLNWGVKLILHLQQPETGLIGVAGGTYIPVAPSSWTTDKEHNFINIIQNNKERDKPTLSKNIQKNTPVLTIDGVFMSMKKSIFDEFRFSNYLKGYHGYDLDLSLRLSKKYKNYVTSDILIEHFSEGNPDENWYKANTLIRKKIGNNFNTEKIGQLELGCFLSYLRTAMYYEGINLKTVLKTMRFIPYKYINSKQKVKIFKHYLNYFRYKKDFQSNV